MNKVVTSIIKASELPATVRGDIAPDHKVEVIVRDIELADRAPAGDGHFSRYFERARRNYQSMDDIVGHVRQIRDGDG